MATFRNDDSPWSPILYKLASAVYPCMYQMAFKLSRVIILCLDFVLWHKHNLSCFFHHVSLSGAVGFLTLDCCNSTHCDLVNKVSAFDLKPYKVKGSRAPSNFQKGAHTTGMGKVGSLLSVTFFWLNKAIVTAITCVSFSRRTICEPTLAHPCVQTPQCHLPPHLKKT